VIRAATDQLGNAPANDMGARVGAIGRAAARMQRLIEDLLDVASIEAGSLSLRLQHHEISALVEDALALVQARAAGKSLQIVTRIADVPPVVCDQQRIQQVLSNLIENAIKFTGEGGLITLSVEVRGDDVELAIADTGPGIPEDQLPHIFDRYFRAPGAGVRGAGLGLSIARGIVEAHGGHMRCESKLGEGTIFAFTLPTARSCHQVAS
jgi:signal transduction histidine kinase